MVKIIDVCSGKGGVGKTTIAANLAVALQAIGKRVAIVDCNLTTSHLSLCFGMMSYPRTLNDALRDGAPIESVTYHHPSGIRIVPASLDLKDLIDIDASQLRSRLLEAFGGFDVVLLDSSPGVGKEAMIALQASDNVIFVANPYIPSLVDVLKVHQLVREMGNRPAPLGVILNRARGRRYEATAEDLSQFVDLPVIGTIPEDESVLESTNMKTLVTLSHPYSRASVAIFELAAHMAGVYYRRPHFLKMLVEGMMGPRRDVHHTSGYRAPSGMI